MTTWKIAVSSVLVLIASGARPAAAAELSTDALRVNPNDTVECTVLNVGDKPVQILVELRDPTLPNGTVFGPAVCDNTNPGDICNQILINGAVSPSRLVSCKITVKSKKVRGILMNLTTGNSSEAR